MFDRLTVAAANVNAQSGAATRNLEAVFHLTGLLPNHPETNHATWHREALQFPRHIAEPLSGPVPLRRRPGDRYSPTVLRARCQQNGVFGLACNYRGPVSCLGVEQSFPGGARGQILAEQTQGDLRAARAAPNPTAP